MVSPPQARVQGGSVIVPSTGNTFDAEAIIKALLADPSLEVLELPHLAADQRKEIKRVASQHPELKCGSFGFGEERQLHIFKRAVSVASTEVPSAAASCAGKKDWAPPGGCFIEKNTFIHDWVESEEMVCEPIMFRSMPVDLSKRTLVNWQRLSEDAVQLGEVQLPFLPKDLQEGTDLPGITSERRPDLSPSTASTIAGSPASIQSSPSLSSQSLHGTPCNAGKISCTIPEKLPSAPALPPGIWAMPVMVPVSSASPRMRSMEREVLVPGTRVLISGLRKLPEFNGLTAVVQGLDTQSGRYDVVLDLTSDRDEKRLAKIRPENLSLLVVPQVPHRSDRAR